MRRTAAGVLSACLALSTAPGGAQQASAPGCEVRIGAVVASNSGRIFDARLEPLKRQFDSLFAYSSYRLLKEEQKQVKWGSRAGFELPGGRYLLVVPREYKDGRVSLKILLIDGSRPLVDTALALRNQGTFLVAGPRHQEGVLIISIGARNAM
jgi:hypothetical protein